ncbi:MAG: arginine decarboxylase [Methanothrix sp.]|nr:MAG: arginine decarboxylase [Methanothrix sp.]
MPSTGQIIDLSVLIIDDDIRLPTANGRAVRAIADELRSRDVAVVESFSEEDGHSIILSDPSVQCILLDWNLGDDDPTTHAKALWLLELVRSRNKHIPIFLLAQRGQISSITSEVMKQVDELVWVLEDTPGFIAGRIIAAMRRYRDQIAPPFTKALMQFAQVYEYSWHTPGHTGGTAFLKSPVGRAFFNYFGENLLRSDLSISVGELGSLLDHSGPIGESEKYAARVFGAHRSYSVTNGTSTSNRIIFMACVTHGDVALVDRNCHKSIEQAITMTGAIPTYMQPSRNYLGLIGPIYPEKILQEIINSSITNNSLLGKSKPQALHSIITNSTYDGLCYNVPRVLELLGESVDRIHFDEAWFGYARFNPLYKNRFGMNGDPAKYSGPTIFTTTSTHKLLAALSQASLINVRDGRNAVDHARFNESFMMHSSTSPQYAIISSNEVSAAMMDGLGGFTLTTESITEAVAFRQMLRRIWVQYDSVGDWFFNVWNADVVTDPATGNYMSFEDASEWLLVNEPSVWVLHPEDKWHGFEDLEDDYCMLDPIKVSVVTPGVSLDGTLKKTGIPATLVTAYLDHRGIVVEKTTDFTILFLFSIGITKGKWGTLINALLKFKEDYEANAPLVEVLPDLIAAYPEHYKNCKGLRDLADSMFEQMMKSNQTQLQGQAFSKMPVPDMTPTEAYSRLVHNEVEPVAVMDMAGRTVATGIVPYPPGIPMLMPGENAGPDGSPYLKYLKALQEWDRQFPGFGHDIHGVESDKGTYFVYCLKKA